MESADLKRKVICVLKDEMRLIGAEHLIHVSESDDNLITLFGSKFRIVLIDPIREIDIPNVIKSHFPDDKRCHKIMLTSTLSARAIKMLTKNNVNFCDANANINIIIGDMRISNEGNVATPVSEASLNLNTFSSLKIVFCLLQYKNSLTWPMRKLSEVSGVSLGTVQRVIEVLKRLSIIFLTNKGRFFRNKRKLLEIWVAGFNSVILPKITLGKASFRNPSDKTNWQNLPLKNGVVWGGEPAAHIYDCYLVPELFAIFSSGDFRSVVRDMGLIPVGNSGYITVLHKFWKDFDSESQKVSPHVAPVLIVYAQLMGSYDSRCVDAAKRILKTLGDEEIYR